MSGRTEVPGRLIIARSVLPRGDGGYLGEMSWWAFRYGIEVRRVADGVEVTVFEEVGKPPGIPAAFRHPAIDGNGEEEADAV